MKENKNSYIRYLVIGVSAFVIFIISMQIISMFVPLSSWKLDFANYTNNILSPVISVLALVGVYATYTQQQKNHIDQLNQARNEFVIGHLSSIYLEFKNYYNLGISQNYLDRIRKKKQELPERFSDYHPDLFFHKTTVEEELKFEEDFLCKLDEHLDNYGYLVDFINESHNIDPQIKKSYLKRITYDLNKLEIIDEVAKILQDDTTIFSEIRQLYMEYSQKLNSIRHKANIK
tara:strand:+ start:601 stop:1296 length:696 start_codon:yes stop_codon:yes gene_type:complete